MCATVQDRVHAILVTQEQIVKLVILIIIIIQFVIFVLLRLPAVDTELVHHRGHVSAILDSVAQTAQCV